MTTFSMSNLDLKTRARLKGVRLYEVAEALGVHETTICRWLRRDLTEDERRRIITAIDQVAERGTDGTTDNETNQGSI